MKGIWIACLALLLSFSSARAAEQQREYLREVEAIEAVRATVDDESNHLSLSEKDLVTHVRQVLLKAGVEVRSPLPRKREPTTTLVVTVMASPIESAGRRGIIGSAVWLEVRLTSKAHLLGAEPVTPAAPEMRHPDTMQASAHVTLLDAPVWVARNLSVLSAGANRTYGIAASLDAMLKVFIEDWISSRLERPKPEEAQPANPQADRVAPDYHTLREMESPYVKVIIIHDDDDDEDEWEPEESDEEEQPEEEPQEEEQGPEVRSNSVAGRQGDRPGPW